MLCRWLHTAGCTSLTHSTRGGSGKEQGCYKVQSNVSLRCSSCLGLCVCLRYCMYLHWQVDRVALRLKTLRIKPCSKKAAVWLQKCPWAQHWERDFWYLFWRNRNPRTQHWLWNFITYNPIYYSIHDLKWLSAFSLNISKCFDIADIKLHALL